MQRWTQFISFVVVLALFSGCGPSGEKRNSVSGTVTYKNEPIKLGTINFRSEGDGKYVGSSDIVNGKYAILSQVGLPAGKYMVAITYPDPKIPAPPADEPPGVAGPVREMLPAKYNDKTELKADIKDGANDAVNFDLK